MIIYTIMPLYKVFEKRDEPDIAGPDEVELGEGKRIIVTRQGGRRYVERLISTDPNDYLNEAYQPGTRLPD